MSGTGRRRILASALVASVAVVGIAGVGAASSHADVMVEVDGVVRPAGAWGGTVGDVLEHLGVATGSHDLVSPDPSERVSDGQTIVVRTAHPFTVSIDGHDRTIWTTSTSTDTILADAGVGGDDVAMPADRSSARPTLTPLVSRPRTVSVVMAGRTSSLLVRPGDDVRTALAAAGLTVSPIDTVDVSSGRDGLRITVTRVTRGVITTDVPVKFATTKVRTGTLFEGEQVVTTKGVTGVDTVTEWAEAHDGRIVHASPIRTVRAKGPTSQVVEVGTRKATPEALVEAGLDPKATLQKEKEADGTVSVRYRAAVGTLSSAAEIAAVRSQGTAADTTSAAYTGGDPRAIAQGMVAARGWADSEFQCLVSLWNRESGWNPYAQNPSGAYGIPQALPGSKMASVGADWATNPATQITWGLGYISGRYGTPCQALAHSDLTGWY